MAKVKPTPELILRILERIPEGFIHHNTLEKHASTLTRNGDTSIATAIQAGRIGQEGAFYYDPQRLTPQQVREAARWCQPIPPDLSNNDEFATLSIQDRLKKREAKLQQIGSESAIQMLQNLDATLGYALVDDICVSIDDRLALDELVDIGILQYTDDFVYDPLRLGSKTMQEVVRKHQLNPLHRELTEYLTSKPGQAASHQELVEKFGDKILNNLLNMGGFSTFTVKTKTEHQLSRWIRLKGSSKQEAKNAALDAVKIHDNAWKPFLDLCGNLVRSGITEGTTFRSKVLARSYTLKKAASLLAVHQATLEKAYSGGGIPGFIDPEGKIRFPAAEIEAAANNPEYIERITAFEMLKVRDLALVAGVSQSTIRRRLAKSGLNRKNPCWGDVRGRWNLPDALQEFREILRLKIAERRAARQAAREEEIRLIEAELERERQRLDALRARLVAAFPSWRHAGRLDQHIALHIGPPNSGKTHEALDSLAAAGSGWYLAPLRLLAFEVFDRLNRRGILCNLLTGEEYIPVDGADITAATIEMFNPNRSGACVIIDEAQMLADPDRGWAWTRALMEAQAPEIHVIAPYTAQSLIEKLAGAAAIPISVVQHERLAPIRVADRHWPLHELPPQTILVAFSRKTVLHLKTELERMKRTVSVVYGNLPPEVRRKQADRFAERETEICVATDAVGMGLNLPADYVCFYEVEKYDGQTLRELTASEVHQIGGRAGRYGFSAGGEIGATAKKDLQLIRKLYETEPGTLTYAYVAPTVEDLEMIPGSLAQRLAQWAALDSIPDSLRSVISTANLNERIELASMLTDSEVEQLGLSSALTLVNAPTRQSSRAYWYSCAQAVLTDRAFPLPPSMPEQIHSSRDLETAEQCIACADIYLWLSRRREFRIFGMDESRVRAERMEWSGQIDAALLRRLDISERCVRCNRILPSGHRYSICDRCFYGW